MRVDGSRSPPSATRSPSGNSPGSGSRQRRSPTGCGRVFQAVRLSIVGINEHNLMPIGRSRGLNELEDGPEPILQVLSNMRYRVTVSRSIFMTLLGVVLVAPLNSVAEAPYGDLAP